MKITELIKTRRSIKQFKQTPIGEEELHSWLEAASYAPNHRMTEPWELLFIGPNTRAKLKHKTDFGNAPVVFAVLSKPAATAFERDENVMAAACFVQNFLLAAHEAGVGTYWASLGLCLIIVRFLMFKKITMLLGYLEWVIRRKCRMRNPEHRLVLKSRIYLKQLKVAECGSLSII